MPPIPPRHTRPYLPALADHLAVTIDPTTGLPNDDAVRPIVQQVLGDEPTVVAAAEAAVEAALEDLDIAGAVLAGEELDVKVTQSGEVSNYTLPARTTLTGGPSGNQARKSPVVRLDADLGLVRNNAAEAASNTLKLQTYIDGLPDASYTDGRTFEVFPGVYHIAPSGSRHINNDEDLEDVAYCIDLTGKQGISFVTSTTGSWIDEDNLGGTFKTTVPGSFLFFIDDFGGPQHQGPVFRNVTLWDNAGGGGGFYGSNVNFCGFEAVYFRGSPSYSETATPSKALVYGAANSTDNGGPYSGGDASWWWFQNCHWSGKYDYAVLGEPLQMNIFGGDMTGSTVGFAGEDIAVGGWGFNSRIFGLKMDGKVVLDWSGSHNEFHIIGEVFDSEYPVRLGRRAAHADPVATPGGNNLSMGNIVTVQMTSRNDGSHVVPLGAVEFGPYATGSNTVDITPYGVATDETHPLVKEDAAVVGCNSYTVRADDWQYVTQEVRQVSTTWLDGKPAYIFRGRDFGSDRVMLIEHRSSGGGSTPVFEVGSMHNYGGDPDNYGPILTAQPDGTTEAHRHFRHGTASGGLAATLGFFGFEPAVFAGYYNITNVPPEVRSQFIEPYTSNVEDVLYTAAVDGTDDMAKLADLNALRVAYEDLRYMCENLREVNAQLIADLAAYGLIGNSEAL